MDHGESTRNANFAALGLVDGPEQADAELGAAVGDQYFGERDGLPLFDFEAQFADAEDLTESDADASSSEAPVYRSVSTMLYTQAHDQFAEPVYRSLKIMHAHSLPAFPADDFHYEAITAPKPKHVVDKQQQRYHREEQAHEQDKDQEAWRVSRMTTPLASYIASPIFALTQEPSARAVVDRVALALRAAGVDASPFSPTMSCFECAVVANCRAYRFEVHVLRLQEACQAKRGATFIMEVQRVSAGGCTSAWAAIVRLFMSQLSGVAFGGYFDLDLPGPIASSAPTLQRSSSLAVPLFGAGDDDDDEDEDDVMGVVADDVLEREYQQMLAYACGGGSGCGSGVVAPLPSGNQLEMAQLLASVSSDAKAAGLLLAAGGVAQVLAALQKLVLLGQRGDCVRAYCTVLANLAGHMTAAQCEECPECDAAAECAMSVLKGGDASSCFDVELLREAAKALGGFSAKVHMRLALRDQVRLAATSCAMSADLRLASHGNTILHNLRVQ